MPAAPSQTADWRVPFTERSARTIPGGAPIANNTARHTFEHQVAQLFEREFRRVYRVMHRLSGDVDLSADLAQEAFVKLLQRGDMPLTPVPWLVTVALNQYRNTQGTDIRRKRLLTLAIDPPSAGERVPQPDQAVIVAEDRQRIRATLDQLPERQVTLLLMSAEGYSYREIATALDLAEASVGALILRAKRAFRALYVEDADAPR